MENKQMLLIGGIVAVAGLILFAMSYLPNNEVKVSDNSDGFTVRTPTTTPPGSSVDETDEVLAPTKENKEDDVDSGSSEKRKVREPKIAISSYSVYIGFATTMGTSSKELMNREVSEVVIGYEWEALSFSPMFSTITFPEWDTEDKQKKYSVHLFDEDSYVLLGSYVSGEEIKFPRDGFRGVSRFKVAGIDPVLGICPGDRSFVWDARFTLEGELGLIRTPITQELPIGETCQMR